MPERPLLILPAPAAPVERRKKPGGGGGLHLPDRERQAQRLAPQIERLQQTLEARYARLRTDAHGIIPEDT